MVSLFALFFSLSLTLSKNAKNALAPKTKTKTKKQKLNRALREDSEMVHVPVSIDTFYPEVAEAAVAAGADIVNDVSGGLDLYATAAAGESGKSGNGADAAAADAADVADAGGGGASPGESGMLETVARLGVPYVLMHMRGRPATMQSAALTAYDDDGGGGVVAGGAPPPPLPVVAGVGRELLARARAALAAGVLPWNLILDPGLGFAKKPADSAALLGDLDVLRAQGLPGVFGRLPMLVGPSRKGFLAELMREGGGADGGGSGAGAAARPPPPPEARDDATAAACVACVARGAEMVRVHNVPVVGAALRVADALLRRGRAQQARQEGAGGLAPGPAVGRGAALRG